MCIVTKSLYCDRKYTGNGLEVVDLIGKSVM